MKDQEEVKRWTAKRKSALVLEIPPESAPYRSGHRDPAQTQTSL